ncbi:MAG: DUF488 domain-containing protein [Ornithinimicrobium sp.]|uniref:DUF488 domain-containing protein n=1 Tax=Ornithinimicrobium sp. TaxID=1977084 RepID=UPI0026DEA76C|nr:DUF488 domain-containing protein [Ornithinimicrobium sp.]MDO5739303.1 DUF488 domain-containing protein [Ornithinimicrobium sp.]
MATVVHFMTERRATQDAPPRVFTVGHSTRDFVELLVMLRANGVTDLVDVRSFPSSRKYPQWNQDAITEALPADIRYRWIRELGGRRYTPAERTSPNAAWRVKAFRDYADHMSTDEFRAGLAVLLEMANESTPAIMCSEAVPWRCHRRLITDALIVEGVEVFDVMSVSTTRRATLSNFAQVSDGKITYPPPVGDR